jgi:DNA helicase-2/ATP-dependent DNA helicase PcrA
VELPDLSGEQKALLDESIKVVDAGPGSGKTRALVTRFLTSAAGSRKGVALVSYTNAAVDEVRLRTRHSRELQCAPHFIGTIDSFLHRFIVTPVVAAQLGRLPTYWQTWDDLGENWSTVRLRDPAGSGIRLSLFRVDSAATITLHQPGLTWEENAYLSKVDKAGRRQALMNVAGARINGLTSHGTFDAKAARLKADQILTDPIGTHILARLSKRFGELLVDETQDCDEAEINIIRSIAGTGVATLVVADPDQAIFEFRGSNPRTFLDYRDAHEPSARASMVTNYRSTRSICAAVTTLRSTGITYADNQDDCPPVFVLAGGPGEQRRKFLAALAEHGVAIENAIVLAHRKKDAMAVTGSSPADGNSRAVGNRLAFACSIIRRSENPAERLSAVKAIERIILDLVDWPEDLRHCNQVQQLQALDRRSEWLRQAVAAIITSTHAVNNADEFGSASRRQLQATLETLQFSSLPLPQRLKKPTPAVWLACAEPARIADPVLASATIHGVKGMEFDAVLLALPAALRKTSGLDVLDEWEQGASRESRRVLHVGASRAKRVLAFGAGPHAERLSTILRASHVDVDSR